MDPEWIAAIADAATAAGEGADYVSMIPDLVDIGTTAGSAADYVSLLDAAGLGEIGSGISDTLDWAQYAGLPSTLESSMGDMGLASDLGFPAGTDLGVGGPLVNDQWLSDYGNWADAQAGADLPNTPMQSFDWENFGGGGSTDTWNGDFPGQGVDASGNMTVGGDIQSSPDSWWQSLSKLATMDNLGKFLQGAKMAGGLLGGKGGLAGLLGGGGADGGGGIPSVGPATGAAITPVSGSSADLSASNPGAFKGMDLMGANSFAAPNVLGAPQAPAPGGAVPYPAISGGQAALPVRAPVSFTPMQVPFPQAGGGGFMPQQPMTGLQRLMQAY